MALTKGFANLQPRIPTDVVDFFILLLVDLSLISYETNTKINLNALKRLVHLYGKVQKD